MNARATSIATNSRRAKESLPTFALLLGLAAEIYFLLGDLSPRPPGASSPSSHAAPIGELISRQNNVKVQNEGELVWEDTQNKQTLYRRQNILTLDDSRAEVAFLDGTGLIVDEKSLIMLEKSPSDDSSGYARIIVRLLHGTLRKSAPRKTSDLLRRLSAKTPEMEIDTGDTRIELSAASEITITARPEDPDGARITVQGGEVKVMSPHGSITVNPGEEALLPKASAGAAPVAHKLPFTLLSPKPGQTIEALAGDQPVRFRWNAQRETVAGHPQEIEVSRDPEFKSEMVKTRIPGAEPPLEYVEINLVLPVQNHPTQWHWRVRTVGHLNGSSTTSAPQSFWVRPQKVPQLRHPLDHAQTPAESAVDFAWEPFEGATLYELEIQGRTPVQTPDFFTRVQRLLPGITHWRVRARLQEGAFSEWSAARDLEVRAPVSEPSPLPTETAPPPPDVLDEPEITPAIPAPRPQHTSFWERLWINSAWADEAPGSSAPSWKVHLKWRAVEGVKKYKIQVAREPTFRKVLSEGETETAEWDWNFKPGPQNSQVRAFFRVASVSASGITGGYSRPKPIKLPFTAKKPALSADFSGPRVGPPANAQTPAPVAPSASVKTPSTSTALVSKPTQPSSPITIHASLDTGFGNLTQSSAASDISSVNPQAPYLQQKISISAELTRASGPSSAATAWLAEFQLGLAGFSASDSHPNADQNFFRAFAFRLDLARNWAKTTTRWNLYWGATLDRSYRWVPNGFAVDSLGALSFGPSARAVRSYRYRGSFFSIRETGAVLDLPATGLLTNGHYGPELRIWGEWNLAAFKENSLRIGLRAEAESAYLRWGSPNGTSTFAWTFWLAPALEF